MFKLLTIQSIQTLQCFSFKLQEQALSLHGLHKQRISVIH
jgi:hypothetical protein